MNSLSLYAGESLGIQFTALADDADTLEDVSGFDFELLLYTSTIGSQVLASTSDPDKLPIERKGASMLLVNIPAEVTARLSPGSLKIEVLKIDKETGVREIAHRVILQVLESKIGKL